MVFARQPLMARAFFTMFSLAAVLGCNTRNCGGEGSGNGNGGSNDAATVLDHGQLGSLALSEPNFLRKQGRSDVNFQEEVKGVQHKRTDDEDIMITPRSRNISVATTRERSLLRKNNFISYVRVIFLGEIPRPRGLVCLVQDFTSSFNHLSTEHQDPDGRQLKRKVNLVKRTLKPISDSITTSGASPRFEALFKVRARCASCNRPDSPASLFASPNLTTSLRPPCEEEMRQRLENAITQAEAWCKHFLRPVKGVDEIAEMAMVPCGSSKTTMTFVLSVGLNADQGTLEDADKEGLELSIMDTYNAGYSNSDAFSRNVDQVTFIGASFDANMKEVEGLPPKFESNAYLFEITMTCWGCPDTLTFFKDGGGSGDVFRQLLSSDQVFNSTPKSGRATVLKPSYRSLQHGSGSTECYHPIFGPEESWNSYAPDEAEFKESLRTGIASVQQTTDILQDVSIVGGLHELDQQTDCSDDLVEFDEDILVGFTGDPGNLSDSTVGALEAVAMYSYNELVFDNCDPNFRFVTNATLTGVEDLDDGTRRLGLVSVSGGGRRTQRTGSAFNTKAFKFKLKLKCRGCKNKKAFQSDAGSSRVRRLDS